MNNMTTTKNGFTIEDVTYRHMRMQSQIKDEIEKPEVQEVHVKAPVSVTPEQVVDFYKVKILLAIDSNEKRVYSQTIRWIKELQEVKKELVSLKEKMIARSAEDEELEDIVEE